MIDRLIELLRRVRLNPTAEELADVLWLALKIGPLDVALEVEGTSQEASSLNPRPADDGAQKRSASSEDPPDESHQATPSVDVYQARNPSNAPTAVGPLGFAFASPAVPALPSALNIGRALRPLKRRIPSQATYTLDEEETARRIAQGLRFPVALRPANSRWLDDLLIVDEAATMAVWRQTVHEFQRLLELHGAFRCVLRRSIITDDHAGISCSVRPQAVKAARFTRQRPLIRAGGRSP